MSSQPAAPEIAAGAAFTRSLLGPEWFLRRPDLSGCAGFTSIESAEVTALGRRPTGKAELGMDLLCVGFVLLFLLASLWLVALCEGL